jgi:hypothetical protein
VWGGGGGKSSQSISYYLLSSSDDFISRLVVGHDFKIGIVCRYENRKDKTAKYDQVFILVWYHFDRRLDTALLSAYLLLIVLVCPWLDLTVAMNTIRIS